MEESGGQEELGIMVCNAPQNVVLYVKQAGDARRRGTAGEDTDTDYRAPQRPRRAAGERENNNCGRKRTSGR